VLEQVLIVIAALSTVLFLDYNNDGYRIPYRG